MSLIPSESQNFPDDFSRAISRARVLHETKRFADANKPKRSKRAGKIPDDRFPAEPAAPPPAEETSAPSGAQVAPPDELQRSDADEDRASLTPKAITRRASPVRPSRMSAKPAHKRPGPGPQAQSTSAEKDFVAVPSSEPAAVRTDEAAHPRHEPEVVDDQLLLDLLPPAYAARRRQRRKIVAFVVSESIAVLILTACVFVAFFHRIDAQLAETAIDIGTITAAFAVAVLPILFFAIPSKLP
jgi:hypothetical protein